MHTFYMKFIEVPPVTFYNGGGGGGGSEQWQSHSTRSYDLQACMAVLFRSLQISVVLWNFLGHACRVTSGPPVETFCVSRTPIWKWLRPHLHGCGQVDVITWCHLEKAK